MDKKNIVLSAAAVASAISALSSIKETYTIVAADANGPYSAAASDAVSRSQSQAEIRRGMAAITQRLRLDGVALNESYVTVAQAYLIDNTQDSGSLVNCYTNCHSACHGSRGWR